MQLRGVTRCCMNMKPCPAGEDLCGSRQTARCPVTACQYRACLGGPFLCPRWFLYVYMLESVRYLLFVQSGFNVTPSFMSHMCAEASVFTRSCRICPYFAVWFPPSQLWPFFFFWTLLFFTFASHGNCNLVCYSPEFWTCGLVCLAGAAGGPFWLAVFMQVQDIEDTPPCRAFFFFFLRGFWEQQTLQY